MNCYYCKEPCQLLDSDYIRVQLERWVCNRHNNAVDFYLDVKDNSVQCIYNARYREQEYCVEWYKSITEEYWVLWHITKTIKTKLIKTQFIPERFTPDTIDKKLPLLLPFL